MDRFALIGPGRLGLGLALALHRAGLSPRVVHGRSPAGRSRCRRLLPGVATTATLLEAVDLAELVILAVPDDALVSVVEQVGDHARGRTWLHLSGSQGREVLEPLARAGGRTLAVHPLQTVPDPALGPERLAGAFFTIDGEPADLPLATTLVEAVGGTPIPLPGGNRALYHAAAVLACNDLLALLGQAFRLMEKATDGRVTGRALLPLVRSTLAGAEELGPAGALTGPVVRGDEQVVRRHLDALAREAPWALELYRRLGLETVALAGEGGADGEALHRIGRILADFSPDPET